MTTDSSPSSADSSGTFADSALAVATDMMSTDLPESVTHCYNKYTDDSTHKDLSNCSKKNITELFAYHLLEDLTAHSGVMWTVHSPGDSKAKH